MLIKSVTILWVVAVASAASVHQRNIPVHVRYDEPVAAESVRNLGDEVQMIHADVKPPSDAPKEAPIVIPEAPIVIPEAPIAIPEAPTVIPEAPTVLPEAPVVIPEAPSSAEQTKSYGVKNLDEKIQLSPEDLGLALKHLPIQPEEDLMGAETAPLRVVNDTPQIEEITKQPDYIQSVLRQAEDIISSGLKRLRVSFKPEENQKVPDTEQWDKLEKAVNAYLTEEKSKLQVKQTQPSTPPTNQNFFQNLASGFQNIANNFIQNLSGGQSAAGNATQGDEGTPAQQGPFQGFINYFQGGVNNIANAITNLGNQGSTTSNTVLGDTGSTTQSPNFISSFVNNVQQFFGQLQGGTQTGAPAATQGDPGVNNTVSGPQGPGQVIQTIGSAITNFIQGRPPNAVGDEGTATTQSSNIIQSIGNVIQNSPLNPFRPQGQKPDDAAAGTTQNPIQAGISGIQNVGSQIQQLVGGQNTTSDGSKQPGDEALPIQTVPQPVSEQNNDKPDEKPQAETASNQVIEEDGARQPLSVNEEVAIVEELNQNKQEALNEVSQGASLEADKQEASKEEVNSSLEEIKSEIDSKETVRDEVSSQEFKHEYADQKDLSQEISELDNRVPDYPRPEVEIPVAIRQPEPFHIELDQEDPVPVEIRHREPEYGEPILEESRPAVLKDQREEILMTAE